MEYCSRVSISKELGFALLSIILAMAAGTAFVVNGMDGGQLNINDLVVDNTCEARVDGGNKDGLILLQTATVAETADGVLDAIVGARAKPFSIAIDCSKVSPAPDAIAKMTFGSVFFSNSKGTLGNDMSISTLFDDVNTTLHSIEGSTIKQVQVNNPGGIYSRTLDSTSKSATYDSRTSYVHADTSKAATAGYMKTNSAYTTTYQ